SLLVSSVAPVPRTSISTLLPYTTLFRSNEGIRSLGFLRIYIKYPENLDKRKRRKNSSSSDHSIYNLDSARFEASVLILFTPFFLLKPDLKIPSQNAELTPKPLSGSA